MGGANGVLTRAAEEAAAKEAEENSGFEPGPDSPAAEQGQDPTGGGKGSSQEQAPDPMSQWQDRRPQFQSRRSPNANMFGQGRFSGGNRNAMQAMQGLGRSNPGGGFQAPPMRGNPTFKPYQPPPQQSQPSGGKGGNASAPAPTAPTPPQGGGSSFRSIAERIKYENDMAEYDIAVKKQGAGGPFNPGSAANLAQRAQGTGGGFKPGQGQ